MLKEIFIRNFAIIDNLKLDFSPGFTVLTGETGAGKSIILDAVTLILGGRADSSMVRAETDKAMIEAVFQLSPELKNIIFPVLEQEGVENEEEDFIQFGREIRSNGRSYCRVNGRSVSLSLMREIATPLLDIHGQGEHLSLLKPQAHLPLLDSYGGLVGDRKKLSSEVDRYRKVTRELENLRKDKRLVAQRIEMLQYQVNEIKSAGLSQSEEEELKSERTRLANAEQLNRFSTEAIAALIGVDDETTSATDILGLAEKALTQLAKLDDEKLPILEELQGLIYQVNEVAANIQSYKDSLEFNTHRLDEVEERLELINTLKRKYGNTVSDVIVRMEQAEKELERINLDEERIEILEKEQAQLLKQIGVMGEALSKKRWGAGLELSSAVESQLNELHMAGARFEVEFSRMVDDEGAYVGEERFAFDGSGIDQAEFVLSANLGEPLKPVAKVASGGETARLMLAIKSALAEVDRTPTLIFDEIDQGIGGRVGSIVGQKLWGLTADGNHQVVVVTHLPQLAGYGDVHYHVGKQVFDGRTKTKIRRLEADDRIDELAAMLGTMGESAVQGAKAILNQVKFEKGTKEKMPGTS